MKSRWLVVLFCLGIGVSCQKNSTAPRSGEMIRAGTYADAVQALAHHHNANAVLVQIRSAGVCPEGDAARWEHWYTDFQTGQMLYLHTTTAGAQFDSSAARRLYGTARLSKGWMDSDQALHIVETQGGTSFRTAHPECQITAQLGQPVRPDSRPHWTVTYQDTAGTTGELRVRIDALTGTVVSNSIPEGGAAWIPRQSTPAW